MASMNSTREVTSRSSTAGPSTSSKSPRSSTRGARIRGLPRDIAAMHRGGERTPPPAANAMHLYPKSYSALGGAGAARACPGRRTWARRGPSPNFSPSSVQRPATSTSVWLRSAPRRAAAARLPHAGSARRSRAVACGTRFPAAGPGGACARGGPSRVLGDDRGARVTHRSRPARRRWNSTSSSPSFPTTCPSCWACPTRKWAPSCASWRASCSRTTASPCGSTSPPTFTTTSRHSASSALGTPTTACATLWAPSPPPSPPPPTSTTGPTSRSSFWPCSTTQTPTSSTAPSARSSSSARTCPTP